MNSYLTYFMITKKFTRNSDKWKMIDEDGWKYRREEIEHASNLEFDMYLKKNLH